MNGTSEFMEQELTRVRAEIQTNREEILRINGELTNLKSIAQGNIADLRAAINTVSTKLEEKSKANIPAIALALAIVPAIWLFVTTYTTSEINRAVTPVQSSTAVNSKQIDAITQNISSLQQLAAGSSKANELSKSDLHFMSDLGNLRTVWQHRINALLWEKTYPGEHYPSESFFPTSVSSGTSSSNTLAPP